MGDNGENLTIVLLSCNRSTLTIKLLDSLEKYIPGFKGEIILFDNASHKVESRKLERYLTAIPFRYRLIKSDKNYGVAGGRNRAFAEVKTDWIMSLDNDIYFISNPFEICMRNIASLGCKFLNLPLLADDSQSVFSNGGSLFIQKQDMDIHLWAGSMHEQVNVSNHEEFAPSLSTFLFGGASIINKKLFFECGGFDDGFFIGFEDLDFSITLFQKGYKIGSAGTFALVHDHKRLKEKTNVEYERERFSNENVLKSALCFENKHGLKVWSKSTEKWLNTRREELGINSDATNNCDNPDDFHKKRSVLFCMYKLDAGGAERLLIDILQRIDADTFDIDVCVQAMGGVYDNVLPDYVNCFDWNELYASNTKKYDVEIAFLEGMPTKMIALRPSAAVKIAWIHTDMYTSRLSSGAYRNNNEEAMCYSMMDHLVFVSQTGMQQFDKQFPGVQTNKTLIYNLIDKESIISRSQSSTCTKEKTKLTMCTVGRLDPVKGIDRLIPILSRLKKDGLDFHHWIIGDGKQNDEIQQSIEQNELMDTVFLLGFQSNPHLYLKEADIFVSTSHLEGLPIAIGEAPCLGKPIVATNVSGTAELLGYGEYGMLVESDKEAIYQGLKEMLRNKELRDEYARKAKAGSETDIFNAQKTIDRITDMLHHATSAKTSLSRIAHHLFITNYSTYSPGLSKGKLGNALFFFHYAKLTGNTIVEDYVFELIDEMNRMIRKETPVGFFDGLAGIGSGIEYLAQHGFIENDTDEVLGAIDTRIHLAIPDLMDVATLAEIGRYLLFRIKNPLSGDHKITTLENKMFLIHIIDLIERFYPKQSDDKIACAYRFLTEVDKTTIFPDKVKRLIRDIKMKDGICHSAATYRRRMEKTIARQYQQIATRLQDNDIPEIQPQPYFGLVGIGLYLMGIADDKYKSWTQLL